MDEIVRAAGPVVGEGAALALVVGATVVVARAMESSWFDSWRRRHDVAAADRRFARRTRYIGRAD